MRYALLCVLLLGCTVRQVPPSPSMMQSRANVMARDIAWKDSMPLLKFRPPWEYGAIRLQVEACSGLTRAGWPAFYIAPQNPLMGNVLAYYDERTQSIVFGLGNENNTGTISHEILHWLLGPYIPPYRRKDETPDEWVRRVHPDSIYAPHGKCGHLLNPGR